MKDVVTAKVLFAAILLGGKTLLVYRDCLLNMAESKQDPICKKLKNLLEVKYYGVGFDDIFAKWLSCNLHRLNDLSVRLLESLDPKSYHFLRMSIVSKFDFKTELKLFKTRAWCVFDGFQNEKRNILEAAITLTNDRGIRINMENLGKVIVAARNLRKKFKNGLERFKLITLDRWVD